MFIFYNSQKEEHVEDGNRTSDASSAIRLAKDCDWSDTKTAEMVGFKARSVIGGYWMQVLAHKLARR